MQYKLTNLLLSRSGFIFIASSHLCKQGSRALFVALFLKGTLLSTALGQQVGATVPFITYEAEDATLGGGAIIRTLTAAPTTQYSSPELEASGRSFVELKGTGQTVKWTNNTAQNITALTVRFAIPDGSTGGGTTNSLNLYINGVFRQSIALSSKQTWMYDGTTDNGLSQDPSQGNPHRFFDETHVWISGAAIAPGSTIKFQQDAANTSAFYWIDLIDIETPPVALTQPANSLSITTYGAVANDNNDDTVAIQNCINAAISQGKSVWLPAGRFIYTNQLTGTGFTMQGAGMWYTTLYRNVPIPRPAGTQYALNFNSATLMDFDLDTTAIGRTSADGNDYGINMKGSNWVVNRVWLQHCDAGVWGAGSDGIVQNSRIVDCYGDGINLNNGNSGSTVGIRLTAANNFVRGSGDDGLAINSDPTSQQMSSITLSNNTTVGAYWANELGIYGGTNILVQDNLLCDPTKGSGLACGVYIRSDGTAQALNGAVIQRNLIIRGGGNGDNIKKPALLFGTSKATNYFLNVTVSSNTIIDSIYEGVSSKNCGPNVTFKYNNIDSPALNGINIYSTSSGVDSFSYNRVFNINSGFLQFSNYAGAAYNAIQTNNSWQVVVVDGTYKLINKNSGLALDTVGQGTTNGTRIDQYAYSGAANQQWTVSSIGSGQYKILGAQSGRSLDVKGQSTADGAAIQLFDDNGGANQKWVITATSGGYTTIQGVQSSKLMEVGSSATTNGAPVDQWSSTGGNNQQWTFQLP